MGLKVSAAMAAQLVGRHERIVRGWIMSGKLLATKRSDGRWEIDTDDLMGVAHVKSEAREMVKEWVKRQSIDEVSLQGPSMYKYKGKSEPLLTLETLKEEIEVLREKLTDEEEARLQLHLEVTKLRRSYDKLRSYFEGVIKQQDDERM